MNELKLVTEFSFEKAKSVAIMAFHDETVLVEYSENLNQCHFPELPLTSPIVFHIQAFLFLNARCLIKNAYFIGMIGERAFFTTRVLSRKDYFVQGFAFLPIKDVFQKTDLPAEAKLKLFNRAYELVK